jgi:fused signal recognition particle receptor
MDMDFSLWIKNSFESGELFFYLVPFFLFSMLLIVVFYPDSKKKKKKDKLSDKECVDAGLKTIQSGVPTVDLRKGRAGFTTIEIDPGKEEVVEEPKTLEAGLARTRDGFMARLKNIFSAGTVTPELIEEMEEILYTADMGVKTVSWLLEEISKNKSSFNSGEDVKMFLKSRILETLKSVHRDIASPSESPSVYLMVGINGAGKTTTIGKLARKFIDEGRSVVFAAADTFRAAAVEQIKIWGERTGATVISDKDGADPASVAYNAILSAVNKSTDIVLIDTAGRLQNRVNLMEELKKINRVVDKAKPGAPHETILVIDANNGQNALAQAKDFGDAVNVSGIIVTKLDGTAKGGVIIGIARELSLPVYMVGIGEKVEDLKRFDPEHFVEALFS